MYCTCRPWWGGLRLLAPLGTALLLFSCGTFSARIAPLDATAATAHTSFDRPYFHRFAAAGGGRFVALRCDGDRVSPRSRLACYDTGEVALWETVVAGDDDSEGDFPELIGTAGAVRLVAGVESDSGSLDIYGRLMETAHGAERGARTVLCRSDATWDRAREFSVAVSRDSSRILLYTFGKFMDHEHAPGGISGRVLFCAVTDSAFAHTAQRNVFLPYADDEDAPLPKLSVTNGGRVHAAWVQWKDSVNVARMQEMDPATGASAVLELPLRAGAGERAETPCLLEREDGSTMAAACLALPEEQERLTSIRLLRFDWRSATAAAVGMFEMTEARRAAWNGGKEVEGVHCQAIALGPGGEPVIIANRANVGHSYSVGTRQIPTAGNHSTTIFTGASRPYMDFGPIMVIAMQRDGTPRSAAFIPRQWKFNASFLRDETPLSYAFNGRSLRLVYGADRDIVTQDVNPADGTVGAARPLLHFGEWAWPNMGSTLWYGPDTFRLFCQLRTGADWEVVRVRL